MANPFYTYSGAFIPGTLARAEQVGAEYSAVQAGFAVLAIQGTDSGTADTYVVTTNGGPSGSYADGNIVEFKAKTSNTGAAATMNVNGIGAVSFTNFQGVTLAAGSIVANTWYRAIYNSTYSAWTLIAPSSVTISTSTISAAAPTNKVGLAAAGGVSLAVVPIDATYALDQSIAPTWTGAHVFSNTVTFNSTVSFANPLTLNGAANTNAAILNGVATAGQSFGLLVKAGTNASDRALQVNNQANSLNFFRVFGDGSVVVGLPTGSGLGIGTLNATGLFVNGAAVLTTGVSSANPSATIGLAAVNGVAATFMTSDSAPPLSQAIAPTWTGAHIHTPSSAVTAVTINARADTSGFIVNGGTNTVLNYLAQFITGTGSGLSSGILLKAGTSSADNAILIQNASAAATFLRIKGDGSGSLGVSATTGMQWTTTGATVINATAANVLSVQLSGSAIFVISDKTAPTIEAWGPTAAALVDMTPDTGSFTATYTGMAAGTTGTANWVRIGKIVVLTLPDLTGTSNANTFTCTGLPAVIQPSIAQVVTCNTFFSSGSNQPAGCSARFAASSGTITMWAAGSATGWGATGSKGTDGRVVLVYSL